MLVKLSSTPTDAPMNASTDAPITVPTKYPTSIQSDCSNATEACCDPSVKICTEKKLKTCKKWLKKSTCKETFLKDKCPLSCQMCNSSINGVLQTSMNELVSLVGNYPTVKYDSGKDAFNSTFAACPVVQYTRKRRVKAMFKHVGAIPDGFSAYDLFTADWTATDNVMHVDFEIYDSMHALINETHKWTYCRCEETTRPFRRIKLINP